MGIPRIYFPSRSLGAGTIPVQNNIDHAHTNLVHHEREDTYQSINDMSMAVDYKSVQSEDGYPQI
jgi:hypothetical protein